MDPSLPGSNIFDDLDSCSVFNLVSLRISPRHCGPWGPSSFTLPWPGLTHCRYFENNGSVSLSGCISFVPIAACLSSMVFFSLRYYMAKLCSFSVSSGGVLHTAPVFRHTELCKLHVELVADISLASAGVCVCVCVCGRWPNGPSLSLHITLRVPSRPPPGLARPLLHRDAAPTDGLQATGARSAHVCIRHQPRLPAEAVAESAATGRVLQDKLLWTPGERSKLLWTPGER